MLKKALHISVAILLLAGASVMVYGDGLAQIKFGNIDLGKYYAKIPRLSGIKDTEKTVSENSRFSFAVLGDTQIFYTPESKGGFMKAMRIIDGKNASFIMTVGDLVQGCKKNDECAQHYEDWKSIAYGAGIRPYPVMGNHDRILGEDSDEIWEAFFGPFDNGPMKYQGSVYSFDFENYHFIVLNSEYPKTHEIDKIQRAWLEADLEKNKNRNIFIFFHQPAFPVNYKIGSGLDYYENDRNDFWRIVDHYGVRAVFNGHEHMYSRKKIDSFVFDGAQNSVYQIVAGNTDAGERESDPGEQSCEKFYRGNNFVMVDVDGENIKIRAINMEGEIVDEFEI